MANLIAPASLTSDQIEEVERISIRLVFQAARDFHQEATYIFANSPDDQTEIAEDITRETLAKFPGFPLPERIFGRMDFKRAGYVFSPNFTTRQALLVDSKAEKTRAVARIQKSQTSLPIRQIRAGQNIDMEGDLSQEMSLHGKDYLVTTIFIHYHYSETPTQKTLHHITIAALPNGRLRSLYVPSLTDTIWVAGPDAPTRGEEFRTRLSFSRLRNKAAWRVQEIQTGAGAPHATWQD